jgi:hypothetical protein
MAAFTQFLDTLPDPNIKIGGAGQADASGTAGQGFVNVSLTRIKDLKEDRTIAGKLVSRTNASGKWLIDLKYNPLTRAQFDPVYNFLMEKQNSLKSFYVVLPTYKVPKSSAYATWVDSNTPATTEAGVTGVTSLEIEDGTGYPSFGDLFTFDDTNDTLHTKAYMVSRVETTTDYKTGNQPTAGSIRIHFTPALQKDVTSGSDVIFNSPKIKVVQAADIQEYELRKDNLYIFSIRLEEALY